MSDLQSLAAYPVGPRPAIEEVTVTAQKPEEEGFSFWDFLDVINPLQHIPVVNTIYREVTGDEIKAPAKLIGSTILGGPIGLAAAMVDTAIEDGTGKDLGGHAMAFFRGEAADSDQAVTPTQTAEAQTAQAATGQSATTAQTSREFIPAALAVAQMAPALSSVLEDDEPREDEAEAARQTQETEAAIAAAAAAAPQGLVFMPLKGRTPATFKAVERRDDDTAFMPIDRTRRQAPGQQAAGDAALAMAAIRARSGGASAPMPGPVPGSIPGSIPGQSGGKPLDPLLEATKPQQETGLMPAADPFAAARRIMEDGGAVAVPAWFDKAMMDAASKYQAMQSVGGR